MSKDNGKQKRHQWAGPNMRNQNRCSRCKLWSRYGKGTKGGMGAQEYSVDRKEWTTERPQCGIVEKPKAAKSSPKRTKENVVPEETSATF